MQLPWLKFGRYLAVFLVGVSGGVGLMYYFAEPVPTSILTDLQIALVRTNQPLNISKIEWLEDAFGPGIDLSSHAGASCYQLSNLTITINSPGATTLAIVRYNSLQSVGYDARQEMKAIHFWIEFSDEQGVSETHHIELAQNSARVIELKSESNRLGEPVYAIIYTTELHP